MTLYQVKFGKSCITEQIGFFINIQWINFLMIHFDKVELKPVYQIFRQNNLLYKKKKKQNPKGLNCLSTLIRIIEFEIKHDSFNSDDQQYAVNWNYLFRLELILTLISIILSTLPYTVQINQWVKKYSNIKIYIYTQELPRKTFNEQESGIIFNYFGPVNDNIDFRYHLKTCKVV